MQMSSTELLSALTQPNGALNNLLAVGNPTAIAAYIFSVSQTLNMANASTTRANGSLDSTGETTTVSPVSHQNDICEG